MWKVFDVLLRRSLCETFFFQALAFVMVNDGEQIYERQLTLLIGQSGRARGRVYLTDESNPPRFDPKPNRPKESTLSRTRYVRLKARRIPIYRKTISVVVVIAILRNDRLLLLPHMPSWSSCITVCTTSTNSKWLHKFL